MLTILFHQELVSLLCKTNLIEYLFLLHLHLMIKYGLKVSKMLVSRSIIPTNTFFSSRCLYSHHSCWNPKQYSHSAAQFPTMKEMMQRMKTTSISSCTMRSDNTAAATILPNWSFTPTLSQEGGHKLCATGGGSPLLHFLLLEIILCSGAFALALGIGSFINRCTILTNQLSFCDEEKHTTYWSDVKKKKHVPFQATIYQQTYCLHCCSYIVFWTSKFFH